MSDRLIQRRGSRQTGTTVEVWAGLDDQPGYQTVCVEHAGICEHERREDAVAFAPVPREWCPRCQDLQRVKAGAEARRIDEEGG